MQAGLCITNVPMGVSYYLYLPASLLIIKPEIVNVHRELENVLKGRKIRL